MRGLKIPLLVTLLVSLAFGVGLGLKLKRDRAAQLGVVTGSRKLKILTLTGALPAQVVQSFGASENIQVELAEEPTPDLLYKHLLAGGEFDLVTLLTTQVAKASQASKIQPLRTREIAGFETVSRDFSDLPGRSSSVVPFLWGLAANSNVRSAEFKSLQSDANGAYKSGESETKASLWILNFALASGAQNQDEAKAFLAYVLKPETAVRISNLNRYASTNIETNSETSLEAQLKPLHLRQVPLTEVEFIFDESAEAPPARKSKD